MPATIKPKRGSGLPASNIKTGELLVDTNNKRVYLGTGNTTADVIGGAAHGATSGEIQFRGANSGEFLSSSFYGVSLYDPVQMPGFSSDTLLVGSVFVGTQGNVIPLRFATNSGTTAQIGLIGPSSVSTSAIGSPTAIDYVLPATIPYPVQADPTKGTSRWILGCDSYDSGTNRFNLSWINPCTICGSTSTSGTVTPSATTGVGVGGFYGQILIAGQPDTDSSENDILVTTAYNNNLRYDLDANKIITPKIEASDTIESTGLILKTGNTGKVKFVAESIEGSEVTVTVPYSAGGYSLLSTANKISDLMSDDWSAISAKLVGKQGTGDVVQKTSPTITTPSVENTLTLVDAANAGVVNITAAANLNCEIFDNTAVSKITVGSSAGQIMLGGVSTSIELNGPVSFQGNIFNIGGIAAPTSDTNKDKGVQFRWHNGSSAKTGFFGYDDSSGKLIFVPDATIASDVVSGTIGEINAKVEWANLLSVPSFATASNNLGYFASTTSSQLAGVISDETGSGALVFGTSPTFTTSLLGGSAVMGLLENTTVTTINFGSKATTINVGEASGIVNFSNDVSVNNHFSAKSKSFVIDHPTKQGKKLRYACLEGPENGVYVRGKLNGETTIVLPEYWVNLVDEETITVNLTGIDSSGYHTVKKIENNKITVESSSGNVNCYYVVYGERKDVSKLVTEFE